MKSDVENARGANTSKFAKKVDLASLKSVVDKLDIDQLKTVAFHLSNLSNIIKKIMLLKILHMMN